MSGTGCRMSGAVRAWLGAALVGAAMPSLAVDAHAQPFSYLPPGDLIAGSGDGREDDTVYAPGMLFPIEQGPAYANSQVYMNGGMYGPGGGQCDAVNYSYPWRDNYCEERTWDMPLCPAGVGHQGQDIRPATCENSVYWCVAAADGTITNVGTYSVYLTAADGTRYDYLHMSTVQVSTGDSITRGQRLGKVSNQFGGTPTTIHLHFNIRQNVDGVGVVFVPPYLSLVRSYESLINQPTEGYLDHAGCDLLAGWTRDPDRPSEPIELLLAIDGALDDPAATVRQLTADEERPDVCGGSSPCPHGFASLPPMRLFDDAAHEVRAFGVDAMTGPTELSSSPASVSCPPIELDGVRRAADEAAIAAWALDPGWDLLTVSESALSALEPGDALTTDPTLITDASASDLWLLDDGRLREVPDASAAAAWRLDPAAAEIWSAAELAATELGPPLRARPILVAIAPADAPMFLLDDPPNADADGGVGAGGGAPVDPGTGGGVNAAAGVPGANDSCGCRAARPRTGGGAGSSVALAMAGLARLCRRSRRSR